MGPVLQALWPCALYLCCSFAMNMLTKTLLTSYEWPAIYTLAAIQNVFTASSVGLYLAGAKLRHRLQGHSRAARSKRSQLSVHDREVVSRDASVHGRQRAWTLVSIALPLAALHVGNTVLGFAAMRVVNMPMYLVLRRLTTLKVLLIEWLVLRKQLSTGIKLALLVSAVGSIMAGSTDATFEPWGYALVLAQNLCSAGSLTVAKESALSPQQIVLLTSTAGAIVCSVLAYHLELKTELLSELTRITSDQPMFLPTLVLMSCVCVTFQFAIMLCTLHNSALATSVTGNIKDLLSTIGGFLWFHDVSIRGTNVMGVGISLLGAYWFSYLKYAALTRTCVPMGGSPPRAPPAPAASVEARPGLKSMLSQVRMMAQRMKLHVE